MYMYKDIVICEASKALSVLILCDVWHYVLLYLSMLDHELAAVYFCVSFFVVSEIQ